MTDEDKFAAMERAMAGDAAPPEPSAVEARARAIYELGRIKNCSWQLVSHDLWLRIAATSLAYERAAVAAERARCVAILRKAIAAIEGTTP